MIIVGKYIAALEITTRIAKIQPRTERATVRQLVKETGARQAGQVLTGALVIRALEPMEVERQ